MRQIALGVAALGAAAAGTAVQAADLAPPVYKAAPAPVFSWTGLHFGVFAGYAWDGRDADYSYNNVSPVIVPLLPTRAGLDSQGALFGGAIGYDLQIGGVVFGAEGDFSWINLGDDHTTLVPGAGAPIFLPPLAFRTDYQVDWLSTIRGRIGVPFDRVLVYGTGGLAIGNVAMTSTVTVANSPVGGFLVGSTNDTRAGWTAGGGVEFAVTDHVTLKGEALYFDLGDVSLVAANPANPSSLNVVKEITGVLARAGINFKF